MVPLPTDFIHFLFLIFLKMYGMKAGNQIPGSWCAGESTKRTVTRRREQLRSPYHSCRYHLLGMSNSIHREYKKLPLIWNSGLFIQATSFFLVDIVWLCVVVVSVDNIVIMNIR